VFNRYYDAELRYLREMGREYERLHPETAGSLSEPGVDPDVERLLEGVAFLTAKIRQQLEDDFPELIHNVLDLIVPQFLRPLPAATVVEFTPIPQALSETRTVPAGTRLLSSPLEGVRCGFRTSFDVSVAPLKIAGASIQHEADRSVLQIQVQPLDDADIAKVCPRSLRLHFAGAEAPARQLLMLLTSPDQCVRHLVLECETTGGKRHTFGLDPARCIRPVGLSLEAVDRLVPAVTHAMPALALLQEYLFFPSMLLFADIDLTGLDGQLCFSELADVSTLRIRFELDSRARSVASVEPSQFRLFCSPAVNLFDADVRPFQTTSAGGPRPLRVEGLEPRHSEIFSVESVAAASPVWQPVPSLYSMDHLTDRGSDHPFLYQVLRSASLSSVGTETQLHLVPGRSKASLIAPPAEWTVRAGVIATNRDLPRGLKPGDITTPGDGCPSFVRFTNISRVTPGASPPLGAGLPWRMVSLLSAPYQSLCRAETIQRLLEVFDFGAAGDQQLARRTLLRQRAILSAQSEVVDTLFHASPVRSVHATVDLDDAKFEGAGDLYLFGAVLHRVLAAQVSVNSFSRLTLRGRQRSAILSFPPILGGEAA
jgi:type VI secretion system protein ImpG